MDSKYNYLLALGYSEQTVESYLRIWAESITDCLAEHWETVSENMRLLLNDLDRELLLKLPVIYLDAFLLEPSVFRTRMQALKNELPNEYADIIEEQLLGYEGTDSVYVTPDSVSNDALYAPFLEIISRDPEDVFDAIQSLKDPRCRIYKFILLLRKGAGLDVSTDDVQISFLRELELNKWEVFHNAQFLLEQGLPGELICDLLWYCPCILTYSSEELDRVLSDRFGSDYTRIMPEAAEEDDWGDTLFSLF